MSHFPRNPWGGARLPDSTEPAGADPLADLLDELRRPALDDELAGEQRWVARISAVVDAAGTADHHPRRAPMESRRFRVSLSAALAGAVLAAMSGLAYAGELPGPAQGVAADVLGKVGVTAPSAHDETASDEGTGTAGEDQPGDTGDTGGTEDTGEDTGDTGGTGDEGSDTSGSDDHGKGKLISQLAHDTPAPGKGKVIAPIASGGKSHVGYPPGQVKKGDAGTHKPDHPDHPDHPSQGGGNGHKNGGGHGNGS